ncbi:putative MFS family arabinose efflux permease [Micromonospora kangleipakensis]|uniref:Putative MFS family arabinose efflux permease n=1 Tax=Micromonospora kangleipakensis TaxID=1077942 RepID=A0A4V2GD57_9ACTN|nr:MFS transporter [Micromonospora kangleipakensis]RZU74606.1 putative MFS family arabinose efflux permease [Micromonospora kangleipakensis]
MGQNARRSTLRAGGDVFVRDGLTLLTYSALGAYTFWLYAFGPALALLRQELHFSYTVLSVYSALWAAGSVLSGAAFAPLAARMGRRAVLWRSALVTTAGAALFTITQSIQLTMLGALVMGFAGTTVQTTTQSLVADHHGPRRDQALVEMNIGAGLCAVIAPLALGMSHALTSTWRVAMALPAVILVALAVVHRHQPFPSVPRPPAARRGGHRAGLSVVCRLLALLVAVGIGVEFCVVYFGAELLSGARGFSTSTAATAMTVFYAGILLGRLAGARLTRRPGRAAFLTGLSLAVTLAGLAALWLPGGVVPALLGLFVTGLGIANQFPLALALTLAAAPDDTDAANALVQLLGGVLVLGAPFLLGLLADHVGLTTGFAVAPVLTALSALLLYVALRWEGSADPAGVAPGQRPSASSMAR